MAANLLKELKIMLETIINKIIIIINYIIIMRRYNFGRFFSKIILKLFLRKLIGIKYVSIAVFS